MKRVTITEFNIFERMLPLVSGYLQAYASADPDIRDGVVFDNYSTTVGTPLPDIVAELTSRDADVYAFSCYLWNMRLVRSVVRALLSTHPDAYILLGGPQVMRFAEEYLDPEHERLLLCNGEGERSFHDFLTAVLQPEPDFSSARGLSFYRGGELVTTQAAERVSSLEEIPSPFLTGVFEGDYRMAVLETNRGCPFRCAFCYWGAATNDRVYKFDEDRIRDELTWLSDNGVPLLYLADANWGMLKRDVELARHIAALKEKQGVPFYVYFAAAKNSPDRVAEIANIFSEAAMLNTQPISMQSLNESTLEAVDRKNIKRSAYERLQDDLNREEISSYIELIWPLPGETLTSFKDGIEQLCELKAAHIIAYPHMLLHNTPLSRRQDELGLVTRSVDDAVSEAELIVSTNEVDYDDFRDGLRFFYGVLALYNPRVLTRLAAYLHKGGLASYATVIGGFAEYVAGNGKTAFGRFCESSIEAANYYEVSNYPTVYHINLHEARAEFDETLFGYASRQPFFDDDGARFLFEVDFIAKPYVYSNTPLNLPSFEPEHVRILEQDERAVTIEVPEHFLPLIESDVAHLDRGTASGSPRFRLDHNRAQHPFRAAQSREENASYCSGSIMRIGDILPLWSGA